jgi:hypothetical protein
MPPHFIKFGMDNDKGGAPDLQFDKNKDNMPKRKDYLVIFNLVNGPGVNLRFVSDVDNVMWAKWGTVDVPPSCPTTSSNVGGFETVGVSDTVLAVTNEDSKRGLIAFTLNFIGPTGDSNDPGTYIPYDPIVDNRNGGSGLKLASLVIVGTALCLAAGALAAYAYFNYINM